MSMGIMGIGAQFMQAGCAKKKEGNYVLLQTTTTDPVIAKLSCTGEITLESVKDGEAVTQTYSDLNNATVSILADANTDIKIIGEVTLIKTSIPGPPTGDGNWTKIDVSNDPSLMLLHCQHCTGLTALDLSNNTALTELDCSYCSTLTALDLSNNTALTQLRCGGCTGLTALDLSNNTALNYVSVSECTGLTALDLSNNTALTSASVNGCSSLKTLNVDIDSLNGIDTASCTAITTIYYPATNESASTDIAGAITNADAADGTVYTDSAAAYYSTIADAATAKGWTIEQL